MFESMSATLVPAHWGLHGGSAGDAECAYHECRGANPMSKRNYPCDKRNCHVQAQLPVHAIQRPPHAMPALNSTRSSCAPTA